MVSLPPLAFPFLHCPFQGLFSFLEIGRNFFSSISGLCLYPFHTKGQFMKTPWPGEIWVLTFSAAIPETRPLEIRIMDVEQDLVWFTYTDGNQIPHLIGTPLEIFPSLYTYVRGSTCKTQRRKLFSFKTVWRSLLSFFTAAQKP
jgi:hypothetical protein